MPLILKTASEQFGWSRNMIRWAFFRENQDTGVDLWPFEKHSRGASVIASTARRQDDTSQMEILPDSPVGRGSLGIPPRPCPKHSSVDLQGQPREPSPSRSSYESSKENSWWNVQAQGNERASHVGSSLPPGRCGKSATRGNPSEPQRPDQCQCVVAFFSAEQTVRSSPLKA